MSEKLESPPEHRTIKIDASAVEASRVMVEAFRLSTQADGARGILNGVLDGLASLVQQDASGVYVVGRSGRRLRHTLFRGCDPQVPEVDPIPRTKNGRC